MKTLEQEIQSILWETCTYSHEEKGIKIGDSIKQLASFILTRERTLIDLLRSSVQEHCRTLGIDGEKGWEEYQKEHLSQ